MGRAVVIAALAAAIVAGCGAAAKAPAPARVWKGPMGKTTDYFAGVWRGVEIGDTPAAGAPTSNKAYVMWSVRLIGESLADRKHVAAFEEKWYRKNRSLRCTRSGTMRFFDGTLIMRVRKNDCRKYWDELERPKVREPKATSVVMTFPTGTFRYVWLGLGTDQSFSSYGTWHQHVMEFLD